ncbi:MAG: TlpA disulfide reductase family protein [Pirellulaceae bacterium]
MKLPLLGLVIASLLILGTGCEAPPPSDTAPEEKTPAAQTPETQTPEAAAPEAAAPETQTPTAPAAEAPPAKTAADLGPAEVDEAVLTEVESLREFEKNPEDVEAFLTFVRGNFSEIMEKANSEPDQAKAQVDALADVMTHFEKSEGPAGQVAAQVLQAVDMVHTRLAVGQMKLEDISAKIAENPEDTDAVMNLGEKLEQMIQGELADDLDAADALLREQSDKLAESYEKIESRAAQVAYSRTVERLQQLAGHIKRQQEYLALVGKDMTSIVAETWINGEEVDPTGKVVLLDFWAVWCGPCIMTFPHLVEMHKEYHDQGLEIVGITTYYNFAWPEDATAPAQQDFEVPPEDEHKMLTRFTEQFELRHPTAVLASDSEIPEYYAQTALPHLVLIGRDGKVRLVEVGAGEQVATKIEAKIKELLAEPTPEPSEEPEPAEESAEDTTEEAPPESEETSEEPAEESNVE